ncbi:TPM domain-containing protein [Mucilaginibacter terrigena]|uniref:TPM domain-containing protein n=1 Tax=Mucilaginibacter terrigena TaxID=2492395 RepID=A0A4Q5LJH3_9SPHI|nr:TPM domain-containing protein [Mucilaginibacter terrigena]RYU89503.1 TPM domain-containing protein [Mucilaginibacter terrigena]
MIKKLFFCLCLVLCLAPAFAQTLPDKPTASPVSDFTGTLSGDQKQQLDTKLKAFEDSTSIQIAVVIVPTVGDYEISDYALKLGRKWGVGTKDKNNGVMVLVALNDRKMTIQTGYGTEGALPDIITQQIIQNDMKPRFREGDYYGGLDAAVTNIIKYTKGEYKAEKKNSVSKKDGGSIGFIIIIVIFILIIVFRKRGGGGGGGRIIGSRGGASPFWWFLAGNMLGGGGRSSGSNWGGFSGGGGSSGGGSWGGFGGGSFGGGGSSGSW